MSKRACVGDLGEDRLIERFFKPIAGDLSDDVAVTTPLAGCDLLTSTDALLEDVHFLRTAPAELVAQKALRANASDIAASGGEPAFFTLSLGLPKDLPLTWLTSFVEGLAQAMAELKVALVGGDTARAAAGVAIGVAIHGYAPSGQAVGRAGAKPGDALAVTGWLGDAYIGLEAMLGRRALPDAAARFWLRRHFCPEDRGEFARRLAGRQLARAMMDLSDGLSIDLPRLCKASAVGAAVELARLPLSPEARRLGLDAEQAWGAGEDYELLFAADPARWGEIEALAAAAGAPLARIGRIVGGSAIELTKHGEPCAPPAPGWRHFG